MMRLGVVALLWLTASLAISPAASAKSPAAAHDVSQPDPLRKVLLDALRPTIQRDLGQRTIFLVKVLRTHGDWAFADVVPRTPAGKPIDFGKTRHAERLRLGMLDRAHDIVALLRRKGGRWRVAAYAVAPTDVAWDGWDREFGAPRDLFALPPD